MKTTETSTQQRFWKTEYHGLERIYNERLSWDSAFKNPILRTGDHTFNFGKLDHPINAWGWYIVDEDKKIMYFNFGPFKEIWAKEEIVRCFEIIDPNQSYFMKQAIKNQLKLQQWAQQK